MTRILVVALLALSACSRTQQSAPTPEDGGARVASASASAKAPAPLRSANVVDSEVRRLTDTWSAALNGHDLAQLEQVYAKRLELYGKSVSREQSIAAKRAAFEKTPTFEQSISDIVIRPSEGGGWAAHFTKRSGAHGHLSSVAALLDFGFEDGVLKIVRESDEPSEARAAAQSGCKQDRDCGPGKNCVFIAGDTWMCSPKPEPASCPKGQIFLPRVGGCWRPCATDKDCEQEMCCVSDPNAPQPICMSRCF